MNHADRMRPLLETAIKTLPKGWRIAANLTRNRTKRLCCPVQALAGVDAPTPFFQVEDACKLPPSWLEDFVWTFDGYAMRGNHGHPDAVELGAELRSKYIK